MVALDFLGLVLAKLTHDLVSLRFLLFAMVGSIGLFVHFAALFVALEVFDVPFPEAQACGALLAMTSNFILNNFLTYRDQRLKGFAILRGCYCFIWSAVSGSPPMSASRSRSMIRNRSGGWRVRPAR